MVEQATNMTRTFVGSEKQQQWARHIYEEFAGVFGTNALPAISAASFWIEHRHHSSSLNNLQIIKNNLLRKNEEFKIPVWDEASKSMSCFLQFYAVEPAINCKAGFFICSAVLHLIYSDVSIT
jgi:hypothetical protein